MTPIVIVMLATLRAVEKFSADCKAILPLINANTPKKKAGNEMSHTGIIPLQSPLPAAIAVEYACIAYRTDDGMPQMPKKRPAQESSEGIFSFGTIFESILKL